MINQGDLEEGVINTGKYERYNYKNGDLILISMYNHRKLDWVELIIPSSDLWDIVNNVKSSLSLLFDKRHIKQGLMNGLVVEADNTINNCDDIEKKLNELNNIGFLSEGFYNTKSGDWKILATTFNIEVFKRYCDTLGLMVHPMIGGIRKEGSVCYAVCLLRDVTLSNEEESFIDINYEVFNSDRPSYNMPFILKNVRVETDDYIESIEVGYNIALIDCDLSCIEQIELHPEQAVIGKGCKFSYDEHICFYTSNSKNAYSHRFIESIYKDNRNIINTKPLMEHNDTSAYRVFRDSTVDENNILVNTKYLEDYCNKRYLLNVYNSYRGKGYNTKLDGIEIGDRLT